MSAKQKIVPGRGPSNINLGIFVSSFDICWVSQPVPAINYDLMSQEVGGGGHLHVAYWGSVMVVVFCKNLPQLQEILLSEGK